GAPALAEDEAVELAHGRAAPRLGGGGQAAGAETGVPGLDGGLVGLHQPARQGGLGVGEIAAVGGQGVGRGVALDRHHLQKGLDLGGGHASDRFAPATLGVEGGRVMSSRLPPPVPGPIPVRRRTIALVGLMGVGKSTVGRRLARRLELPFADGDIEIEAAASMTVSDIFAELGEAEFRAGEARVMKRLLEGPRMVLATGGGAILNPETRALLKARAVTVWMRADLDTVAQRVQRRDTR